MILCNRLVQKALDDGRLVITPEPNPRVPSIAGGHCPYDTHSVDLRLFEEIVVPRDEGPINVDWSQPGDIAMHLKDDSQTLVITDDHTYKLSPNKFILAKTLERIELPFEEGCETCLAARIEGKSSRARFGLLVHFTAPTVHPGYKGQLTLEMINLGPRPITLSPGLFIAQLIVEEVRGCPIENPSQFQE